MSETYPADQQVRVRRAIQNINAHYKARIKELEARVEKLEAENKRLQQTKAKNSRLTKENTALKYQVQKLSTDLTEAYDVIGILNKRAMNNERRVRRDS